MKTNKKTELLNLICSTSGEVIQVGEIVAIHDWGISSKDIIGYGKFEWEGHERRFKLDYDRDINNILDTPDFSGIEDNYDLFRTTPRKLTDKERELIEVF